MTFLKEPICPCANPWIKREDIKELLSIEDTFLRTLRESGEWILGIHYVYLNPDYPRVGIRYNTALCLNWMANRQTPESHRTAINVYCTHLELVVSGRTVGEMEQIALSACTVHLFRKQDKKKAAPVGKRHKF